MIGMLKGVVAALAEDAALIDVHGVGYLVSAGSRTLSRLAVGEGVTLRIETHVREDAIRLFAFTSEEERAWFVHLQSVPGVGAKVALAVLDVLPPGALLDAVQLEDKASIARANGVGPKLAARLAQELKTKPPPTGFLGIGGAGPSGSDGPFTSPATASASGEEGRREGLSDLALRNQAVSALVNLGYGQPEALRAVSTAYRGFAEDPEVSALVRAALKELGR
jgi:holliday junction DNA helicase RuvA